MASNVGRRNDVVPKSKRGSVRVTSFDNRSRSSSDNRMRFDNLSWSSSNYRMRFDNRRGSSSDDGLSNGYINRHLANMEFRLNLSDLRSDGGDGAGGSENALLSH